MAATSRSAPPPSWDQVPLTAEEREVLKMAGYGGRVPFGRRPVLLVVDATLGFFGPRDVDLRQAVATHPLASGGAAWRTVGSVRAVVSAARDGGVPIVFTRPSPLSARPGPGGDRWGDKNDRVREPVSGSREIIEETGYRDGDLVLEKEAPSAFHGTPLLRWLAAWQADGVVVCGGTTSGCVRATVVDAFSANLAVTVVGDGCFDRIDVSHRVGLFDMDLKYADVADADEVAARIREVRTVVDTSL